MILYRIGHIFFRFIGALFHRLQVVHRERLIEEGPAFVVCNHVSFLDPPMVGASFRNPLHYLARKSLFIGPLKWILPAWNVVPVDRGKGDMASLKRVLDLVKLGERVVLFPEGTRSPNGELIQPEPGIGFLIAKSGAPVLPVRIFGTFEAYPRHAWFPRPGKVIVSVGQPIDFSTLPKDLTGRALYQAHADKIMEAIGAISKEG